MENTPEVYVLGCGNILFGDDGFGPEVIKYFLENYKVSENVYVKDTGTGIRNILFDILLSEKKPRKIIIVDALDCRKTPGEIFEVSIEDLPKNKIDDFSMHQVPSSNLLYELKEYCGIEVIILSCQVENIPSEVNIGLSETLQSAIPKAAEKLKDLISGDRERVM